MAVTRKVLDPQTGKPVWVTTYVRHGKIVTQRLGAHLFRESLTPRRLEAMADFTEVASQGFGRKKTGTLPPAAEVVRDELPRKRRARLGDEQ
jgi:hypothetical protein